MMERGIYLIVQIHIQILMKEMLSQEQKMKVVSACLENVRLKEENELEKQRILNIIKKLPETRQINTLKGDQKIFFELLHDGYLAFRQAYIELSMRPQNAKTVDDKLDINEYLLKLIPNIGLQKDKFNQEGLVSKVFVLLIRELPKISPKTSKDFIKIWRDNANQKLIQKAKKKEQYIQKIREETKPKKEESPKKPVQISDQEQEEEESEESPQPQPKIKEKSEQEKAREAREKEKQKQRDLEKEKEFERRMKIQKEIDEKKRQQQRRLREQNLKKSDKRQTQARQVKGKSIEAYINSRKDLVFQKGKSRQISDYLAAKLDQFLKVALEQMYDVACLKNKKNPKFGNELGYFSEQNERIQYSQDFYFQPNTKIYSLYYKHKHDIYSQLRIKEIKKQDELRNNLEAKTNEGDKKIQKKIENYILKPRSKDSDQMLVPYREQKDGYRNQSITISIEHVIYFLENHPWLRNSLLLFEVYHRY